MTNAVKHLLYVEGPDDQRIFKKILTDMRLSDGVDVNPPSKAKDAQKTGNGVANLITSLDKVITGFKERRDNRLAIVVDADYFDEINNKEGGFLKRRNKIRDIISRNGYDVPEYSSSNKMKGEVFQCRGADMPPIGLWIMPNHHDDGMMEDLIIDCINHENSAAKILTNHATPAIERLVLDSEIESHLFDKNKHLNKIKFETWIKWQKGHVFEKDGILDMEHENIKNIKDWLKRVFIDDNGIED